MELRGSAELSPKASQSMGKRKERLRERRRANTTNEDTSNALKFFDRSNSEMVEESEGHANTRDEGKPDTAVNSQNVIDQRDTPDTEESQKASPGKDNVSEDGGKPLPENVDEQGDGYQTAETSVQAA